MLLGIGMQAYGSIRNYRKESKTPEPKDHQKPPKKKRNNAASKKAAFTNRLRKRRKNK
jgi:hypothetical protein